jgi:shikimate dehydrogenase
MAMHPIDGRTELIAHLGHPTGSFRAPLIWNPYFASAGVNAVVVPMDCRAPAFADVLRAFFALGNARGALVTMPHKVAVMKLLDRVSPVAAIAGSCNAVRRDPDGRLAGDMFDGEGFVRALRCHGVEPRGASALVVGSGGVGSAIAASLAAAGVGRLALFDADPGVAAALEDRLRAHHPSLAVDPGSKDPAGFDVVVNATPLGMSADDAMPVDVARLDARSFVADVILRTEETAFLAAARARGCRVQPGIDMLFEMIPAYLEFFGLPTTTAEVLRSVARLPR